MSQLLLTGCFPYSQSQLKEISDLGYQVTYHTDEKSLVENPELYDVVVCNGLFLYNDINNFKNLKAIQVTSAGLDRLPLSYINDKGIKLDNARGVYSVPIAEFTVMNVLNVLHKNELISQNMKGKQWKKVRTCQELCDQNVLIVGCGNIGQEIAKRLHSFSCNIIGVDTNVFSNPYFTEIKSLNKLDELLPWASIVILSCPLNESTKRMFDWNRLSLMKDDSIIVNIARGELIVEEDLIEILKQRPEFFAILDVFEHEPLAIESPLWNLDNAVLSPHNSFVSIKNSKRMYDKILAFLANYLKN